MREIVTQIKEFAGDDFIIAYGLGWSSGLESDVRMAQTLEQLGIDMLHVSSGIPSQRKLGLPKGFSYNDIVYTGAQSKQCVNIPVIAVNDIQTLNRANTLLEQGQCDFTAFGRPFLADPAFLIHSRIQSDYAPCFRCKACKWLDNYEKCPARKRELPD